MAKSVNKALLLGYVGKAPEIRSTAGGTLAASFSLATTERQEDRQGNWTDKTEWHNLVAYGRTAEIVRDYVNRSTHLFIQGKIQTRSWDDKESGEKKYRTEIVVSDLTLLGDSQRENGRSGRDDGQSESGRRVGESTRRDHEMDAQFGDEALDPSEIPF
ncbi:MAG TPA: single-stranded DNA-binding protein [Bryobacteraceae bacterium]|jgi:single-strand DNA-binding protein